MHLLGKILAVLVVIGAGANVVFMAKLLEKRTGWIKVVENKKASYLKDKDEPAKLRAELEAAYRDYHRVNSSWGKVHSGVTVQQGGVGVIVNGAGTAEGVRQGQVLHFFQPDGKQGSVYVGPFRVENVADGQFGASFAWIVRKADMDTLRFGADWRVRENVPTADTDNFVAMQHAMLLKDVELKDAVKLLDFAQNRDRKIAEDQLQFRINELHGDPANADKKGILPDYLVDGLVTSIENAEEARNVTLSDVEALRQKLQDVYDEIAAVKTKNDQLIQTPLGANAVSGK